MKLRSKITHESKTVEGVRFTVRVLNQIRKAVREEGLVQVRAQIRAKHDAIRNAGDDVNQIATLADEAAILASKHVTPAYLRAGLISIEGLEIDDKPITTVEDVLEFAPDELLDEILTACNDASGLSEEQQKNSQSPTTSSGAVGADQTTTTA